METPPFPNLEEDKLFEYLNSLSPLKTKKCVTTQTLNSLGMDYSLLTSPDEEAVSTNSVQPSPIANQEPSGLSGFDLNAPPASTALPIVRNEMPGFDLNAPPASTALPTAGNEIPDFDLNASPAISGGQTSHAANRTSKSVRIDQMTSEALPSTSFPTDTDIKSCKCKRSECSTDYCECLAAGAKCTETCKCEECNNIHGRKNSTAETKSELEETKALQISRP